MAKRHNDFIALRNIHDTFTYNSFDYHIDKESILITFDFTLESKKAHTKPTVKFKPTMSLAITSKYSKEVFDTNALNNLIFHMGMVELISYWKAACSPRLIIKPYNLNEKQILFWKKLYWNGLGEFFYTNQISTTIDDFMQIEANNPTPLDPCNLNLEEKIIVPIGGGKDSVVSLELLKASELEVFPFIINPRAASLNTVSKAGILEGNLMLAKRTIDPNILDLNAKGYLNGHTPFSAMLAFTSLLQAYLIKTKYIALSNESSANEPSVADSHVNHQYSKTYEFESDFRNYYKSYINSEIEYFSFLRPISELQIACLFSKFENHHFSFRSCNVGSKKDEWCCNCPKCLFIYTMLAPFVPEEKLNRMIGENLILKPSLAYTLKELRGLTEEKPFECVGTVDEVNLALNQALKYNKYPIPAGLILSDEPEKDLAFKAALKDWNPEHFAPKKLESILRKKISTC